MNAGDLQDIDHLVSMIQSQRRVFENDTDHTKMEYGDNHDNHDNQDHDHESTSKPQPQPNTDHFRKLVKSLLTLENELDEISSKAKELRNLKKEYREQVMLYMLNHHLENLNLPDGGTFSLATARSKLNPLTKLRIPDYLTRYFVEKENVRAETAIKKTADILSYIDSIANYKETKSLRRNKKKSNQ